MPAVNWIKQNKLFTLLILVLLFLLSKGTVGNFFGVSTNNLRLSQPDYGTSDSGESLMMGAPSAKIGGDFRMPNIIPPIREAAPAPEVKDRMVVTDSHLSLLVKDVAQTIGTIKKQVAAIEGYMVNSYLSRPEEGGTGTITVRIPQNKLDETLSSFKKLAVKVVSENLTGTDVTDEYVDNNARLEILKRNKARFEEIMTSAVKIEDILRVQQEIFNLQSQIDSITGQQNYLTKTSQMAKITIYLSTDELELPYAPSQPWKPEAIFKKAVRSLLTTLQSVGTVIIWLFVYSVIWLPLLILGLFIYRKISVKKGA